VTTSGEPPSGAGGVSEPDWIDQILQRATEQVDAASTNTKAPAPIVPDTGTGVPAAVQRANPSPDPAPLQRTSPRPDRAPEPTPIVADGLAEIRWVDETDVVPASTPIARQASASPAPASPALTSPARVEFAEPAEPVGLVPSAVGRSAWDDQLASVGVGEPEGWDKLSWQDLDDDRAADRAPLQEQTSFGRLLREWGPVLFSAVVIALFVRLVLVQAYHIPSTSMVPTLERGDRVVVNRLSYQFGEVERGQVVVFAKPQGTDGENDLIKRVVGLPGETIRFVDDQVYIDGLRLEEPYLQQPDSTRPRLTIPGCAQVTPSSDTCLVPAGHIFMMGDNRLGSSDSRVFGPIEIDTVVGRAFMRVWPLNNLGQL